MALLLHSEEAAGLKGPLILVQKLEHIMIPSHHYVFHSNEAAGLKGPLNIKFNMVRNHDHHPYQYYLAKHQGAGKKTKI